MNKRCKRANKHMKRYSTPLTDIPVHTWNDYRKSPQTGAGESEPHRLLLVLLLLKTCFGGGGECVVHGRSLRLTSCLPGLHTTFCVEVSHGTQSSLSHWLQTFKLHVSQVRQVPHPSSFYMGSGD